MYTKRVRRRVGMILAMLLVFAGCATPHPVPVGPGGISREGRAAEAEQRGLRVTVTVGAWDGAPRDLDRVLLLFHLRMENGSTEMIRLPLERVTLLDPARRQWRPLTPTEAHALAVSGRGAVGPALSFGIAGGSGRVGVGIGAGIPLGGPSAFEYPDILGRGLTDREVPPGGRQEGFLYFPRLDLRVKRFTLLLAPLGGEEMSFDFALAG